MKTPTVSKSSISLLLVGAVLLLPSFAAAQTDPKFSFAKVEPLPATPPAVEWKAQAKAGGLISDGNSQVKSALVGFAASRKAGDNRLTLDGGLAYGKTNVLTPVVDPAMPNTVTGIERRPLTTTNNWFAKGRYDRFLTANNSAYVSAQGAGDRIAGKKFFGGGQVGYSRQLLKDTMNLVVAEIGYDFSHELYVQQPGKTLDPVSVHSARLFLGETLKLSDTTGITGSAEALFNVNKEGKALNAQNGTVGVDPLKDTRIIVKAALTTTVWKALSVAFGATLRYDQNPAPLPVPGAGLMYAAGFQPFAQTVDTMAEATLIYTFL